jgi:hypothetical protein
MNPGRIATEPACDKHDRTELAARLGTVRAELFGKHGLPELARQIGVPIRVWCSYEAGATVPGEVLLSFLEKTGANSDWLLNGKGPKYHNRLDPAAAFDRAGADAAHSSPETQVAAGSETVRSAAGDDEQEPGTEVLRPGPAKPQFERRALAEQIDRMNLRLGDANAHEGPAAEVALAALEAENRRLRQLCEQQRLVADELAEARSQINALQSQVKDAESVAGFHQDESRHLSQGLVKQSHALDQARQSARAEIDALRAEGDSVRAELRRAVEELCRLRADLERVRESKKPDLTSDERMLAFRQHLQDVHVQEVEERDKRRRGWTWISRRLRLLTPSKPAHTPWKATKRNSSRALNA